MLDLGTSFLASVARDPNALAIVDGAEDVDPGFDGAHRRISRRSYGLSNASSSRCAAATDSLIAPPRPGRGACRFAPILLVRLASPLWPIRKRQVPAMRFGDLPA